MPLKTIPKVLSPDLLHVLSSMGHGDEIVLADAHFPASSVCRSGPREVRADGLDIPTLLKAIMKLLPLDEYVAAPVALMDLVDSDKAKNVATPVWGVYHQIVDAAEGKRVQFEEIERFKFYARAKQAYAIVQTGETAIYGNIILKKGICFPSD